MESPGTPGTPSRLSLRPLEPCTTEHIAAAVESLGPAYAGYAKKVIEQDIDGVTLVELLESPIELDQLLIELGVSLVAHQ